MSEMVASELPRIDRSALSERWCRIFLNGKELKVRPGSTISLLLAKLALAEDEVAVEMDRVIVRRADWPLTEIRSGATIEVVHFVGGG